MIRKPVAGIRLAFPKNTAERTVKKIADKYMIHFKYFSLEFVIWAVVQKSDLILR